MLSWKPMYNHVYIQEPPKSILTFQTAFEVYEKLKNFIGMRIDTFCPAEGWPKSKNEGCHRHLFTADGFHHAVRGMPNLKKGWRRLDYEEFCDWYGLKNQEE